MPIEQIYHRDAGSIGIHYEKPPTSVAYRWLAAFALFQAVETDRANGPSDADLEYESWFAR